MICMNLIYLCSPYSHTEEDVMEARYVAACKTAARLMEDGYVVYSPIAHSHPIAQHMTKGKAVDYEFWMNQNIPMLRRCDKLVVLKLLGWESSRGVQREIRLATTLHIPIEFLDWTQQL